MNFIKIGKKTVGANQPCFIIAEAGVNHNGSLDTAKKLVDVAVDAGADAVKFQLLKAKGLYVEDAGEFITEWGQKYDIYGVWKKNEIPNFWMPELKEYCKSKNIIFFSSVFDEESVEIIHDYVDAIKIGSSEITHLPLLRKVARTGKAVIFSIGGAELNEVEEAISTINSEGNYNLAVMFCVAKYPTPLEFANVNALKTLKEKFPNIVIGYSDHSLNQIQVPVASIVNGAKIIEKHFTLNREMEGIDHKMSLEPIELKEMVTQIRNTEEKYNKGIALGIDIDSSLWGDGEIKLTNEQKKLLQFVRRKIFAIKEITVGEEFSMRNLAVLRPGNRGGEEGLHPRELFNILGKKSLKSISPLDIIKSNYFD